MLLPGLSAPSRVSRRAPTTARHRLSALREYRGLTQCVLADRLGIRQDALANLERRGDPRLSTIARYVRAIDGDAAVRSCEEFGPGEPVELAVRRASRLRLAVDHRTTTTLGSTRRVADVPVRSAHAAGALARAGLGLERTPLGTAQFYALKAPQRLSAARMRSLYGPGSVWLHRARHAWRFARRRATGR